MRIEPHSDAFPVEMLCLRFAKDWSDNFKDEMLSLEETWEDVMTGFQEMTGVIEEMKEADKPEETRENDVRIAGSYEIKSTEVISDAYKSGDTVRNP